MDDNQQPWSMPRLEQRPCLLFWFLSVITMGIYGLFWYSMIIGDINRMHGTKRLNARYLIIGLMLPFVVFFGGLFLMIASFIAAAITQQEWIAVVAMMTFYVAYMGSILAFMGIIIYTNYKIVTEFNTALEKLNERPIGYFLTIIGAAYMLNLWEYQRTLNYLSEKYAVINSQQQQLINPEAPAVADTDPQ